MYVHRFFYSSILYLYKKYSFATISLNYNFSLLYFLEKYQNRSLRKFWIIPLWKLIKFRTRHFVSTTFLKQRIFYWAFYASFYSKISQYSQSKIKKILIIATNQKTKNIYFLKSFLFLFFLNIKKILVKINYFRIRVFSKFIILSSILNTPHPNRAPLSKGEFTNKQKK